MALPTFDEQMREAAENYAGDEPTIGTTRVTETCDREIWEWLRDAHIKGAGFNKTLCDKRAEKLVEAFQKLVDSNPLDGVPGFACIHCDMGGAGYSSKGPDHHDDSCPVRHGIEAISQYLGEQEKKK